MFQNITNTENMEDKLLTNRHPWWLPDPEYLETLGSET